MPRQAKRPETSVPRKNKRLLAELPEHDIERIVLEAVDQEYPGRSLLARGLNAKRLMRRGFTVERMLSLGYDRFSLGELGFVSRDLAMREMLERGIPRETIDSVFNQKKSPLEQRKASLERTRSISLDNSGFRLLGKKRPDLKKA